MAGCSELEINLFTVHVWLGYFIQCFISMHGKLDLVGCEVGYCDDFLL